MKMTKQILIGLATLAVMTSCTMENPLLKESPLEYGAPQFDKIKTEHFLPALKQGLAEARAEIEAVINNPEAPTFENTIEAMEQGGRTLNRVSGIFYNILEANTNDELQAVAEEISPLMTEFNMYVNLNDTLFNRIKTVYEQRDSLNLEKDQLKILEDTYKSFARRGANLPKDKKSEYSKLAEEFSLLKLKFKKNVLSATNAFTLDLTDSSELAGLPQYVIDLGRQTAEEKGKEGWVFDLSYPSYGPFMKYSSRRDLREKMYFAYNSRAFSGEFDNNQVVKDIVEHRLKMSNLLGYETYANSALEDRMLKSPEKVNNFLQELMEPSLPKARAEVAAIRDFAKANGFEDKELKAWDFSYWQEKYKQEHYSLSDAELKPYFKLENCIDAVFNLATRLYGLKFEERKDLPVYHPDVKVFDVKDSTGRHLALFYVDFFPRASKRGGAWMTEFRGQSIIAGVERRPLVSLVTNFSKPTGDNPSLLTHDEFTTFLHEFGHSLHGMFAEGRYESLAGTNVTRDFVELPSQIMENWAFQPEYLNSFAKHYQTGEAIPESLVTKIVDAKNYLSAYHLVRQLHFGILDMAWHTLKAMPSETVEKFEKAALAKTQVLPPVPGTCISTSFSHVFSGGYSAGYYSYKWAEVLEADAFSLFEEKGIFNTEVASSFRENILSKGSLEEPDVLYRNFRGHDPETSALLVKFGIVEKK